MMTSPDTQRPFRGIIPPMITPLAGPDQLDRAGLERVIEHILAGGVTGLFILGTTGEAPSLSYRLRRELIEHTCNHVGDRAVVLVGITDTSLIESVALAHHAGACGADAVVSTTPYYFPVGQAELLRYVRTLAQQVQLPLLLYNMPMMTKLAFTVDTVREAMQIDNIVGMKDSSGDMSYHHKVCALLDQRPDWSLLMGPDILLADSVLLGAHGGVPAAGNIFPRLYVDMYEAAVAGDMPRVRELHQRMLRVDRIFKIGRYGFSLAQAAKCVLAHWGICEELVAEPFDQFNAEERRLILEVIEKSRESIAAS